MRNPKLLLMALVMLALAHPVMSQTGVVQNNVDDQPAAAGDVYYEGQPFWSWQAGVEATYLSLEMRALEDNNPFELPVPFGFEAAPRIWLQAQNANGFGGQVRYWQSDAEASVDAIVSDVVTAGITTDISISQAASVEMYALDAEATPRVSTGWLRHDGQPGRKARGDRLGDGRELFRPERAIAV